jgi:hypothetical protein
MVAMWGWFRDPSIQVCSLEAGHPLGVGGKHVEQDLDRDLALQPRVPPAIHLGHPAHAEQRDDFVRPEARSAVSGIGSDPRWAAVNWADYTRLSPETLHRSVPHGGSS